MSESTPTNDPLKFAVAVKTEAEFMRLPPSGEHDPIFALKRSFLSSLVLPSAENNWRPPVRSIILRRKKGRKGVRLIEIASLRAFIHQQLEVEAERQARDHPQAAGTAPGHPVVSKPTTSQ